MIDDIYYRNNKLIDIHIVNNLKLETNLCFLYQVKKVILHPDFDRRNLAYTSALLILEEGK